MLLIQDHAFPRVQFFLSRSSITSVNSPTIPNSSTSSQGSNTSSEAVSSDDNITKAAKVSEVSTQCLIGMTALIVTVSSILNTSSMASLWLMINQIQMYFLLLLIRSFIPNDVKTVIKGSKFTLNISEYIPFKQIRLYESFISMFGYKLNDSQLNLLDLNSDSTTYNILSLTILIFAISLFHSLVFILYKLCFNNSSERRNSWLTKTSNWIVNKTFKILTFGLYIRIILEMTQLLLIVSVHEVYHFEFSETAKIISLITSVITQIILLGLFSLMLIMSFSTYSKNDTDHNLLGELFSGIKMEKMFKNNSPVSFLRRAAFVAILITLISFSEKMIVIVLSVFQLVYAIYSVFIRPYEELKCNLINILNEIYFLILLCLLIFWNKENDWNSIKKSICIWILCSNSLAIFVIVIVDSIKSISTWIRKKCSKSSTNQDEEARITPKMTIKADNLRHLDEIRSNMVQDDRLRQSMSRIPEESKVALDDSNSFIKPKMIKIVTISACVSIDASSGELTITAPTVSANTDFSFYINSAIRRYTNPIQKIITLTIINCSLQNCEECDASNSSICSKCSSGYVISTGSCIFLSSSSSSSTSSTTNSNSPVSSGKSDPNMASSSKNSTDTAKALKTTTQCIAGATAVLVTASNIMNTSSMANLWLTINQVQMYFLLLLTKAFIPDDVQTTIVGSKLALNMPNYIPVTKIGVYESLIGNFYFELSDVQLDLLGIPSDSTIYNAAPFIMMLLLATLLHTFLFVLNKLFLGVTSEGKCSCLVKIAKCIVLKLFMVLTFGYYIRSMLEMAQFLVISSVYEIYQFNISETLRVESIIFSFVVFAFPIALFSFMLYLSLSSYK